MHRFLLPLAASLLILSLARADGPAPSGERDPVKLAPQYYKVTLDNDQVRVLDIHMPAGAKSPMHCHPGYIIYMITGGKARFTAPDGKTTDVELKPGETLWRDAESHAVENTGDTEMHVLNIEFKQKGHVAIGPSTRPSPSTQPIMAVMMGPEQEHVMAAPNDLHWQAGPPTLPPGVEMTVLSGDPTSDGPFVARFHTKGDYTVPPHFHPADESVTVVSGKFFMGEGDKIDQSKARELPPGGYSYMPAGVHHFAYTKGETVIQINGIGPWGITYVNPADDPMNGKR